LRKSYQEREDLFRKSRLMRGSREGATRSFLEELWLADPLGSMPS